MLPSTETSTSFSNITQELFESSTTSLMHGNPKPDMKVSQPDAPFLPGLVTKATLETVLKVNSVVVILVVGLVGSVLNVVNSAVFYKQGLKDPVTVTLFVLSVADFGSVVTLWLRSLFFILLFFPHALPHLDPSYLSGLFTWPHAVLVRVSCLLTVFIAFERWVCITFPLQANRIITMPVAKGYNFVVTVCLVATFISLYCYSRIEFVFLPQENRSLFIVTLTPSGFTYAQRMSSIVTSLYLATFSLLIFFTILIIIKLNQQTKWRQGLSTGSNKTSSSSSSAAAAAAPSASTSDNNKTAGTPATTTTANERQKIKMDALSTKNRKVVKMVAAICLIYIATTVPSVVNTLVYIYVPGYVEFGRYYNLYQINNQICFTFEIVNSTCNFFIYFHMSSNFSTTLRRLLGKESTK